MFLYILWIKMRIIFNIIFCFLLFINSSNIECRFTKQIQTNWTYIWFLTVTLTLAIFYCRNILGVVDQSYNNKCNKFTYVGYKSLVYLDRDIYFPPVVEWTERRTKSDVKKFWLPMDSLYFLMAVGLWMTRVVRIIIIVLNRCELAAIIMKYFFDYKIIII